jgi:hypothetical protein
LQNIRIQHVDPLRIAGAPRIEIIEPALGDLCGQGAYSDQSRKELATSPAAKSLTIGRSSKPATKVSIAALLASWTSIGKSAWGSKKSSMLVLINGVQQFHRRQSDRTGPPFFESCVTRRVARFFSCNWTQLYHRMTMTRDDDLLIGFGLVDQGWQAVLRIRHAVSSHPCPYRKLYPLQGHFSRSGQSLSEKMAL